jgi:hypothetical protein
VSSKRSLKKQQKRQVSALEEAGPGLRQSLARADLARLEDLLRSLRRVRPRALLVETAEAVLDLAAGRLDAVRSRLTVLIASAGTSPDPCADPKEDLPPGLLASLRELAADELAGDHPYLQAADDLYRALQSLEACAFAPAAAEREALAACLDALRAAAPALDGGLRRLLDDAGRYLSLLADLAALDAKLAGLPAAASPASQTVAWLRGPGPLLATVLGAPVPPLLAPLRHAVQTAWRAVLARVVAGEGAAGLATLATADPRLLADLELPGGRQGGLAALRQRAQVQELLAGRRYAELADLLRARSRIATEESDLAALWSLELWARSRPAPLEAEEFDDDPFAASAEPPPHSTLVRLQEMAGEVGRRFAAEHRAEVAQVLRTQLFDLCEQVNFCGHTAGAALSLLEHQPGDAGLLIAGVAGALAGGDPRAFRLLKTQLDHAGKVPAGELAVARRLMAAIAQEEPRAIARILEALKPSFATGAWTEITALVAREMSGMFAHLMTSVGLKGMGDRELGRRAFDAVRVELSYVRPALEETAGFAAIELALDCWRPDEPAVVKRLAKFLAASPGCEAVLAAFQILDQALTPWSPKGLDVAYIQLAHAAIDRLDDRWPLWCPAVPGLALAADSGPLKQLEKKIRQRLAAPETGEDGREALSQALAAVDEVKRMRRGLIPSERRPARSRKKKPRRRRGEVTQAPLDF